MRVNLLARVLAEAKRFRLNADQRAAVRDLRAAFGDNQAYLGAEPMTVVVDGMLGTELPVLYYLFVLLRLRERAKRPLRVIVVCARAREKYIALHRLYGAFFDVHCATFADLVTGSAKTALDAEFTAVRAGLNNRQDVLKFTRNGIQCGFNIYAGYLRRYLVGTINAITPDVLKIVWEGLRNLVAGEVLIARFKPSLLMLTHSDYHTFGSLQKSFLHARIPVAITFPYGRGKIGGRVYSSLDEFESHPRNYAFSCTDETWLQYSQSYGDAEDARVAEYLRTRFAGLDLMFNGDYHRETSKLGRESMAARLGIPADRKTALIAAHLLWDDATSSYRNIYADYEQWLRETLRVVAKNPHVTWIVKAHPSEAHMGTRRFVHQVVTDVFGNLQPAHVIFLPADSDLNTYSLIDFCDAVVTVRGTIGFEAACMGKAVITAGSGPYTGMGFSTEFSNAGEYETYLLNLHEKKTSLTEHEVRQARIGIYVYLLLKPVVSPLMLRGDGFANYQGIAASELLNDAVFTRFADRMLSGAGGDLL